MTSLLIGPLVRATNSSSVLIWAECTQACWVTLKASPIKIPEAAEDTPPFTRRTHTVLIGGHHYAAAYLDGLQPATWYTYQLDISEGDDTERTDVVTEADSKHGDTRPLLYCFRTMNVVETTQSERTQSQLYFAYGSCRKSEEQGVDALSAFGSWLSSQYEQREMQWPHLLLLIGDQIYADQPPAALKQVYPQLAHGANTFEDFALLYEYAWTKDKGTRQALAVIPTYMIFDDHEITNNWNISPTWRASALQKGLEQALIDGLVAYWVYQGWGNLDRGTQSHLSPLLSIMQEGEQSGEDVLEELRTQIKQEMLGKTDLHWHYTIPTQPPIFVANARVDRTAVSGNNVQEIYAPARIMGQSQMNELQTWMRTPKTGLSLLVSSVPVLLPPAIGLAEYIAGKRYWQKGIAPLQWVGVRLARLQQKVALRTSFDHWPTYSATWQEFMHALDECEQDMLVLSGDVHFCYAMEAHRTRKKKVHLYQFVSTPLQNVLNAKDQRLIERQAGITHLRYGGLRTRMLPLHTEDMKARIQHDILFQNALAFVKIETKEEGGYTVQQEYLGSNGKEMAVIGRTVVAGGLA